MEGHKQAQVSQLSTLNSFCYVVKKSVDFVGFKAETDDLSIISILDFDCFAYFFFSVSNATSAPVFVIVSAAGTSAADHQTWSTEVTLELILYFKIST